MPTTVDTVDEVTLAALRKLGCIDDLDLRMKDGTSRRRILEMLDRAIDAGERIITDELPIFGEGEEIAFERQRLANRRQGRALLMRT